MIMKGKNKSSKLVLKNREYIYSVACILLMIDQLVKLLVRSRIPLLDEVVVIPNFFSFYHIENTGAAFSIFSGAVLFLIILSIFILVFLHFYIISDENMSELKKIGFGIVIGGIIGNLVDRILYGAVIDYLAFSFFGYSFPVFNIADVGITVGFIILIIDIFRSDNNESGIRSRRKWKKN